jgi:riboflavin synthase
VSGNTFEVNIVPHTQQETIISNYNKGSRVNIEVDIIARYLERLLQCGKIDTADGMASGEDSLMNKIHDMYAD